MLSANIILDSLRNNPLVDTDLKGELSHKKPDALVILFGKIQ